MGHVTEQLLQAILALPEGERLELTEVLLASQDESNELPFDPAWLNEARRRSDEVANGTVSPAPWSVVRQRLEGHRSERT